MMTCGSTMIIELHEKKFTKEIVEPRKSAVVLFYMPRCPYCIEFMPRFLELSEKIEMTVAQVNISSYDSDLWEEYHIDAVPTVIAFRQGQVCARADAILHKGLSINFLQEEIQRKPECFHVVSK